MYPAPFSTCTRPSGVVTAATRQTVQPGISSQALFWDIWRSVGRHLIKIKAIWLLFAWACRREWRMDLHTVCTFYSVSEHGSFTAQRTCTRLDFAHLRQACHNSKFVIFQEKLLKVLKCYNFLWAQRRHNCSPAASFANCVMTLYLLKVHLQTILPIPVTQKCQILSCGTPVASERFLDIYHNQGRDKRAIL